MKYLHDSAAQPADTQNQKTAKQEVILWENTQTTLEWEQEQDADPLLHLLSMTCMNMIREMSKPDRWWHI